MRKVYDFNTDQSFGALLEKFDRFHDWIIQEIRVFPSEMESLDTEETEFLFDSEIVFRDPYRRFDKTLVSLKFENVNSISAHGLSVLGTEIDGLVFKRTTTGVKLSSLDSAYLRVEAEKLSFGIS